jgi:ATP adenylyltransferase
VKRLWSPWRLTYVSGGEPDRCIFCHALKGADAASLMLFRGPTCFVILNLYPYNNGHLMVVPNRHVATLADASPAELSELMALTRRSEIVLNEVYKPQGLNVGINLGRPAGAGIVDHLHVHIVPRWTGDTNFMTVVGDVRVLPEALEDTARRLRPVFEKLSGNGTTQ